jgi:methionyl aminopeptidase
VITIKPIISAGSCHSTLQPDRWTVRTADGSLSAHHEHTIVITKSAPILLTTA